MGRLVISVISVLLCKFGVNVSDVVVVKAKEDEEGNLVDSLCQVVFGESEVVVIVLDGVSDPLNV